jgi:hypothetical protein
MQDGERAQLVGRLTEWRPRWGVLSVYLHVDPGDRRRAWRIELRERLRALAQDTPAHDAQRAFKAASSRVLERFPEEGLIPEGRGHVGFVEVAETPSEIWRSMQTPPRRVEVGLAPRALLRPLIEIFDEAPYVGVVVLSAERVRLLEWSLGAIRQLDDWELVLWSRDWRERKAERSLPGGGEWTSASGRDQFDQRLDANRRRFLREVGQRVRRERGGRGWRHLIAFGSERYTEELGPGLGKNSESAHFAGQDLISAPEHEIAERVEAEVRKINTARELRLVGELEEAIGATPGAALGPLEVLDVLAEGRVRHLIFDADREYEGQPLRVPGGDQGDDGLPVTERMIELAVATSAEITPLMGEPATRMVDHGGVGALLRY